MAHRWDVKCIRKSISLTRHLSLAGLLFVVASLPSCGLSGSSQSGEVLDEATDKPIEGAIVVAQWIGDVSSNWADSKTTCYHVATAVTGNNGKYKIPGWSLSADEKHDWHKNLTPRDINITVYKAGYAMADKSFTSGSYEKGIYFLKPFEGGVAERLEYLFTMSVSCSPDEDKKLVSLYRSLHSEANTIATTKEDKLMALTLLVEVEKQEVGSTEAWRRFEQRKRDLR